MLSTHADGSGDGSDLLGYHGLAPASVSGGGYGFDPRTPRVPQDTKRFDWPEPTGEAELPAPPPAATVPSEKPVSGSIGGKAGLIISGESHDLEDGAMKLVEALSNPKERGWLLKMDARCQELVSIGLEAEAVDKGLASERPGVASALGAHTPLATRLTGMSLRSTNVIEHRETEGISDAAKLMIGGRLLMIDTGVLHSYRRMLVHKLADRYRLRRVTFKGMRGKRQDASGRPSAAMVRLVYSPGTSKLPPMTLEELEASTAPSPPPRRATVGGRPSLPVPPAAPRRATFNGSTAAPVPSLGLSPHETALPPVPSLGLSPHETALPRSRKPQRSADRATDAHSVGSQRSHSPSAHSAQTASPRLARHVDDTAPPSSNDSIFSSPDILRRGEAEDFLWSDGLSRSSEVVGGPSLPTSVTVGRASHSRVVSQDRTAHHDRYDTAGSAPESRPVHWPAHPDPYAPTAHPMWSSDPHSSYYPSAQWSGVGGFAGGETDFTAPPQGRPSPVGPPHPAMPQVIFVPGVGWCTPLSNP
jgi:hypothetical protein